MQLKRLGSIDELNYTDIICFGGYRNYIELFEDVAKGLYHIKFFVSIDTNHPNTIRISGVDVPCVSLQDVKKSEKECSLVIMDDYPREYFNLLKENEFFSTIEVVWWIADRETSLEISYREKYQKTDLENIIVFRSGPHASEYIKGMDFSDNARALFDYLLNENVDKNFLLVWIVKNPKEYDSKYINRNVKFVSWEWACTEKQIYQEEYYRILCLAKYIFFTDAYGFARNAREDQIRIQLWHGVGFKSRVNFVRCENRYEYKIDPGKAFAEKSIDLYGLREDQVKILGYPKIDWLFEKDNKDILSMLGIDKTKKMVVWAPTFRKTGGRLKNLDMNNLCFEEFLPILESNEILQNFNDLLNEMDMMLVIKLHPFQDELSFYDVNLSNIMTISSASLYDKDIQMNQLLKYADALISDYSSTATEYMQLDRPIGFIINDQNCYKEERQFAFNPIEDWLPGEIINTYEEFVQFVKDISLGKDKSADKRHKLFPKMHRFIGWGASKRIAEEFGIIKKGDETIDATIKAGF